MGIDIRWKMIEGATLVEWEKALKDDTSFAEWTESTSEYLIEILELDDISPYYDSPESCRVYGYKIKSGDGVTKVDIEDLLVKCLGARADLKEEFGIDTYTMMSQDVW